MKKQSKKTKGKDVSSPLFLRRMKQDNSDWIREMAKSKGYSPSVVINRIVQYVRTETSLEML